MQKRNNNVYPWVLVMLTNQCNLRCKLCNIWKEKSKKTLRLSGLVEILNMILRRSGYIDCLGITGGKPFSQSEKVKKLFAAMYPYILRGRIKHFNITTNGTFPMRINSFLLTIPQKIQRDMSFNVSVDGLKAIHEVRRGRGAFDKTMETINVLRARGMPVTMNFVINFSNANDIYAVYMLAKEMGCDVEYEIFSEDVPSYYHYVRDRKSVDKEPQGWRQTCAMHSAKILNDKGTHCNLKQMKLLNQYFNTGRVDKSVFRRCETPSRLIFIRATGEIYTCPHEAHQAAIANFNWEDFTAKRDATVRRIKREGCRKCLSTMGALNYVQ